jgi:hypothetical protein
MQNPRHTSRIRNELIEIPFIQVQSQGKGPEQLSTKGHAGPEILEICRVESRKDVVVGPLVSAVQFEGVGGEFILRWGFHSVARNLVADVEGFGEVRLGPEELFVAVFAGEGAVAVVALVMSTTFMEKCVLERGSTFDFPR